MKRRRYPSDQRIKATVALAREMGLTVTGIEVASDGTVRTIDSAPPARSAAEAWLDKLEQEEGRQ